MNIAESFRRYGERVEDTSPLSATLTKAATDDPRLLDIASEAPPGQPEPELLLAAVHYLILNGQDHSVARFYPSCGGDVPDENPMPNSRDFCLENENELRSIIATRRCQTNDVGRSAVLLPAFEYVARKAETRTLAQIEIGTSAGLNLNWDHYRYNFTGVGTYGSPDSPVTIKTGVRGNHKLPLSEDFPLVTHQRGIDLNTLEITNGDEARWLHALIHPERVRRHAQLDAAFEVARENRPILTEGDALDELPHHLSDVPEDAALIVFSTHVLYQRDEEMIADLYSLLRGYSSEQPVYWLSIDPKEDLGTPTYRLVAFTDGNAAETPLAQFESYGNWVRWIAD